MHEIHAELEAPLLLVTYKKNHGNAELSNTHLVKCTGVRSHLPCYKSAAVLSQTDSAMVILRHCAENLVSVLQHKKEALTPFFISISAIGSSGR